MNWKGRKHGKYEENAKLDQHQPMIQPVLLGANLITWNRINDRKISVLLITFFNIEQNDHLLVNYAVCRITSYLTTTD